MCEAVGLGLVALALVCFAGFAFVAFRVAVGYREGMDRLQADLDRVTAERDGLQESVSHAAQDYLDCVEHKARILDERDRAWKDLAAKDELIAALRRELDFPAAVVEERTLDPCFLDARGRIPAALLLSKVGLASSNSEGRRAIQMGAVTAGTPRRLVDDPMSDVAVSDGLVVRVGSRKAVRVRLRPEGVTS